MFTNPFGMRDVLGIIKCYPPDDTVTVRYHSGGSMKLNARILHLTYMVYNLNIILLLA